MKLFLKLKIHILRSYMIFHGTKKGLGHPTTIRYSQKLDEVLNQYSKLN
ncbi:aspartyl-phosphate phosphatase Spo0E family protein [Bacillus salacetis]